MERVTGQRVGKRVRTRLIAKARKTDNSDTIYLSRGLVLSNVVNGTQGTVGLDCPDPKLGADGGNHAERVWQVLQRDYWGLQIQGTVHRLLYRKNLNSVLCHHF